jgi:hypothetical protein
MLCSNQKSCQREIPGCSQKVKNCTIPYRETVRGPKGEIGAGRWTQTTNARTPTRLMSRNWERLRQMNDTELRSFGRDALYMTSETRRESFVIQVEEARAELKRRSELRRSTQRLDNCFLNPTVCRSAVDIVQSLGSSVNLMPIASRGKEVALSNSNHIRLYKHVATNIGCSNKGQPY